MLQILSIDLGTDFLRSRCRILTCFRIHCTYGWQQGPDLANSNPLLRTAINVFFGAAPLKALQLALPVPFALSILLDSELRCVFALRKNASLLRWLTW